MCSSDLILVVAAWCAAASGQRDEPAPRQAVPVVELGEVVEAIVVDGADIDAGGGAVLQVIQAGAAPVRIEVQVRKDGDAGGDEGAPRQPDPEAEARKQTAEKLRQRVDVRINNKSLKAALDELAEAHGFKYRFDEASLEQAEVEPEKALVGLNVQIGRAHV